MVTFEGKDAQLDAAIKHLQGLLKTEPRPVPQPPAYPDKSFKNGGKSITKPISSSRRVREFIQVRPKSMTDG